MGYYRADWFALCGLGRNITEKEAGCKTTGSAAFGLSFLKILQALVSAARR